MTDRTCSLPDCERPHRARGLCSSHYNAAHQPDRHKKVEAPCVACGALVLKDSGRSSRYRIVCSYRCRYFVTHGRWPEARKQIVGPIRPSRMIPTNEAPAPERIRFISHECKGCGGRFITDRLAFSSGTDQWCSKTCIRAEHRHRRRALQRGAPVVEAGISSRAVMLSDGPACHLCGFDVDPKDFAYAVGADGRPAFMAGASFPSLDHVVALARGGDHSRANTRLACCLCNSLKNDRPMSEVA